MDDLAALAAGIDPDRPLQFGRSTGTDLHVHVGTTPLGAGISGVPDGHGVRLRRAGHPFPTVHRGTGLGSVYTAAVLAAEVFKEIIDLAPNRHVKRDRIDLCPVTLAEPGVAAEISILDHHVLIGAGAIGTAVALILRELSATGTLAVVDPESFEEPNVATYSLGDLAAAAKRLPKVDILVQHLPGIDVRRHPIRALEYLNLVDNGNEPPPRTVLGAVDSIHARHEIARLHANLVLDGSTGGNVGTTVGLSEATFAGPCLRCYYPQQPSSKGQSAEQLLAQATGLRLDRIARGDLPLTKDDLRELSPNSRRLLSAHLGRPVCGLARALDLTARPDPGQFRPSIVFAAQQAAALVVGALIRHNTHPESISRDIEYDTLYGPQPGMVQKRNARHNCTCQTDAKLIQDVRARRNRHSTS
ncbi:MAG: ThiF family adenylyltransferase [Actinobacteria bacterium]|nr:ThiF family adenylyltransferase [Actinomycetota bacterium]MBI3686227.1 ThiF family adenylyltransferase [Actinomycetota bacterium]